MSALIKNPQPGPKATTMKPATAGPITCENWRAVEFRLTAESSLDGPTIEWMSVCCAGPPIAPAKPCSSSRPKSHHVVTTPPIVTTAIATAAVISRTCATIWTFRLS